MRWLNGWSVSLQYAAWGLARPEDFDSEESDEDEESDEENHRANGVSIDIRPLLQSTSLVSAVDMVFRETGEKASEGRRFQPGPAPPITLRFNALCGQRSCSGYFEEDVNGGLDND